MNVPRINLVIPTTGDPQIAGPLFKSIIKNTVGSYSVIILKQEIAHPNAQNFYGEWMEKCPNWRFIDGTDNMILTARNIGMMESYRTREPGESEQWFAEMDDDIILPPSWDEDMIKAAQGISDGAIFVPLLTFRSSMYYKDQVAALPQEIWKAMCDGEIDKINEFHSKYFAVEEPKLQQCYLPEYCFIMRRTSSLVPLLWDTAFDIVRNASRANEDLMLKLRKYSWSAWVVQSVMVFHRGTQRDVSHPKRHYAASTLSNYLNQKWPEYKNDLLSKFLITSSEDLKAENATRNMPKGLPPKAIFYFKEETK